MPSTNPHPMVPQQMTLPTGLLISVNSISEAEAASRFPLAIIDFKDPLAGALGRCSDEVLNQVQNLPAVGWGYSAACGELKDWRGNGCRLPPGLQFAKAGPAGIAQTEQMRQALLQFKSDQSPQVMPVAVAYADHLQAGSLPVEQILAIAIESRFQWFLIDTFTKDGRRLLDWMSIRRLTDAVAQCRAYGIRVVLAGSLSLPDIPQLCRIQPDLLGIRGAVCTAGRATAVDPEKIAIWCQAMNPTCSPAVD